MEGNWEPRIDISRYQNPNRGRNIAIFAFVAGVIFLAAGIVSFVVALGHHAAQDSVQAVVTDVHVNMEGMMEDEFGSAYATYH